MKKIVYISDTGLTIYLEKIFFIKYLLKRNVFVEYWNIRKIYSESPTLVDEIQSSVIVNIDSRVQFEEKVKQNRNNTVFIPIITFGWDILWMHIVLHNNKCYTAFIARGFIPQRGYKISKYSIINRIITSSINISNYKRVILDKISLLILASRSIKRYNTVLCAGASAVAGFKNESNIINVNHHDYDLYLSKKYSDTKIVDYKYAVFLDENTPYHPDSRIFNINLIDSETYFAGINNVFQIVEKKYAIKIVIALHPTSDYDLPVFKDRDMFKYKTNELIKNCEFVLSHASTSVCFPVLYLKPIIFLYNDKIKRAFGNNQFTLIRIFHEALGGNLYNVDSVSDMEILSIPKVNHKKYFIYKYNYITSKESENTLSKEILFEYITNSDLSTM